VTKYRVTIRTLTDEIIDADNPYMAAVLAGQDGREVVDVRPALGRPRVKKKAAKKKSSERKPMSPESRARLAKNLEKARAARKRNLQAAKRKKNT
jgi:hypothetical protein